MESRKKGLVLSAHGKCGQDLVALCSLRKNLDEELNNRSQRSAFVNSSLFDIEIL